MTERSSCPSHSIVHRCRRQPPGTSACRAVYCRCDTKPSDTSSQIKLVRALESWMRQVLFRAKRQWIGRIVSNPKMAIIAKQGIAGHVRETLRQYYLDYC